MPCAAKCTACWLDPHCRSIVVPGTVSGKPAASAALRPTLRLCSPTWLTQPAMTSSTTPGSIPARSTRAPSVCASRSTGCQSFRQPLRRPTGVRTASTITASRIVATAVLSTRSAFGQPPGDKPNAKRQTPTMRLLPPSAFRLPTKPEALAQRRLAELADRRARDLRDEFDPVGDPPAREVPREVGEQILGRCLVPLLEHHDRQRPFAPLGVRHRDDRGLGHGWMPHERVLQRHRADPL